MKAIPSNSTRKQSAVAVLSTAAYGGVALSQVAEAHDVSITSMDIARWKMDSQGNALVQLHDGSIRSLAAGSFDIVNGRLVVLAEQSGEPMNVPANVQPATTMDVVTMGLVNSFGNMNSMQMASGAALAGLTVAIAASGNVGHSTADSHSDEQAVDIYRPNNFARNNERSIELHGSTAADSFVFGYSNFSSGSNLTVSSYQGDDRFEFGGNSFYNQSWGEINAGDGDNIFVFGATIGNSYSDIHVTAGNGDQSLSAGYAFVYNYSSGLIEFGDGNHTLTFEQLAAEYAGALTIILGNGDHVIDFGADAATRSGHIEIFTGDGELDVSFGSGAADDNGKIIIDFGTSLDRDTLSFSDNLEGHLSVLNWQSGVDDLIGLQAASQWSAAVEDEDLVFTISSDTGASVTFVGLAGASTDPLDYFI